MAYTKTAGITTTGLTSSTTLANHIAGIETAIVAVRKVGNQSRVDSALKALSDLSDLCRELHV